MRGWLLLGLVLFIGCSPVPAARPTPLPISAEPILSAAPMDAQLACATRAPAPVTYSDFSPLTSNSPRTLFSVMQDARATIAAVNADAAVQPLTAPRAVGQIHLAADGSVLAYEIIQGPSPAHNSIEIRSVASTRGWRITPGGGCAIFGFALDDAGQRVVYGQVVLRGRLKPSAWQVVIADLTAPESSRILRGEGETALIPIGWAAATNTILFRASLPFQASGNRGVWQAQPDGSHLRQLLRESDFVGEPRLSPDGRWLAYLASDAERLPKEYIASPGEPPANRIATINLLTGEKRTLAQTMQSFGDLAWSGTRLFFTEGIWTDNQFRYDKIQRVDVNASSPETRVTAAPTESIGSVRACQDDSVVYVVNRANESAVRWWKDGRVKTLLAEAGAEYRVLGCVW